MLSKHLPLVLTISILCAMGSTQASSIGPHRSQSSSGSYPWHTWIVGGMSNTPSSPDNWLGGTGNWSNSADWSAGLPGSSSDVSINTGNDAVALDVSSSINSLTLGGASGSSSLTATSNALTLTIAGVLTVNQSGNLYLLSGDIVTAGANSTNLGNIDLEGSSSLQVNGDLSNSGTLHEGYSSFGGALNIAGTLTNSGTISMGEMPGPVTVGGLVNTGSINLGGQGGLLQVNGGATNSGAISVGDGKFSVGGNLLNSGTVSLGSLSFSQMSVVGTLTNTDTGILTAQAQQLINLGAFVNQGQVIFNSYDGGLYLVVAGDVMNSGTITFGSSSTVAITIGGTLTNSSGAQFNVPGDFLQVSAVSLINQGSVSLSGWGGGKMTVGSLVNSGGIYLNGSGLALQVNGDAANSGLISSNCMGGIGCTISIAGKLTNNSAGTFSLGGQSVGDVGDVGYITNAGTISVASGATLNVTGGTHAAVNALPGFLNSGIVNISQGSTVASPLTYTQTGGQTTVDGTLKVSGLGSINFAGGAVYGNGGTMQGNVISNAAINIGDSPLTIGQLFMMGNYTQGANGGLTFDLAGAMAGQYDQLNVSGKAQLNGLMMVDLLNGYIPQIGNMFDIMNFASGSGTFSKVCTH